MSSTASHLSSSKYGYDFVVATTQASINSDLKEYLNFIGGPATYVCFLNKDGKSVAPTTLNDIKNRTGVDPFEIPAGTHDSDPRIAKLSEARFQVGMKLKLGLPPGIPPKNLPPIVQLGSSANNVIFNLFVSEFVVIENIPGGGWNSKGSWNVWSQPVGKPWYFSTHVDLLYKDLDKELNTPYFNKRPKQKEALKNKLQNLSSDAYSLQQLLFDLDNAAVESSPNIEGMPSDSEARDVVSRFFVNTYVETMKNNGEPVIAVKAVASEPDHSSLRLTGIEREIGQFVDAKGEVVQNPSTLQKDAVTLDYLCAANNNPLPGAASFSWNWVEPQDVDNIDGVISVKRNTFANFYLQQLVPLVKTSCIRPYPTAWVTKGSLPQYKWLFHSGKNPQTAEVTSEGSPVATITYDVPGESHGKFGLAKAGLKMRCPYTCSVNFSGSTITIVQRLKFWMWLQFDLNEYEATVYDKTITDTITLSVGQDGTIQHSGSSKSEGGIANDTHVTNGFVNLFTGANDIFQSFQNNVQRYTKKYDLLTPVPTGLVTDFIFPGGKVFTFKDVRFSDYQDLVADITYVNR